MNRRPARRASANGTRASQKRGNAQRQLFEREGLGHVVVAATDEAGDSVVFCVTRGEKDDRHEITVRAQSAADLEAVNVGQHHVEHDEIGRRPGRGFKRAETGTGRGHLVAHVAQGSREELGDRRFVVHDENASATFGIGWVGPDSGR